jgi:hypothetical protein
MSGTSGDWTEEEEERIATLIKKHNYQKHLVHQISSYADKLVCLTN